MYRLMGIDFGEKRIGIAFSDLLCMIAKAHTTYTRVSDDADILYFQDLVKKNNVGGIIIGLPLNMQGEEQALAGQVRAWGSNLTNLLNIPIKYIDERLTSKIADDILKSRRLDWKDRKLLIDALSAEIILQEYLDSYGGKI